MNEEYPPFSKETSGLLFSLSAAVPAMARLIQAGSVWNGAGFSDCWKFCPFRL